MPLLIRSTLIKFPYSDYVQSLGRHSQQPINELRQSISDVMIIRLIATQYAMLIAAVDFHFSETLKMEMCGADA